MSIEQLNIWKIKCDKCGINTAIPCEYTPSPELIRKFGYHTVYDHTTRSFHLCSKCFEEEEEDYA